MENTTAGSPKTSGPIEKRKIPYRVKINTPVILKTEAFKSETINAQIVNISEGGIGLSLNSEVEVPSPLSIELELMDFLLRLQGEVRWGKIFDDGKYYCGMQFLDKDEHQESLIKGFLYTNEEYIDQKIKELPIKEKADFEKIETFFKSDVKGFIEDLIDLEQHIKNKTMSEAAIFEKLTKVSDEIVKKGDKLERQIEKGMLTKKIRDTFRFFTGPWGLKSKILERAFTKPHGYRGDYMLMEMLYNNKPFSEGIGIYFDRYLQNNPYSIAVRGRRKKITELLKKSLQEINLPSINVLNLGCGSCPEIKDLFDNFHSKNNFNFTCIDFDQAALDYSKERLKLLPENIKIKLQKENVINLMKSQKEAGILGKHNLVYSFGLADYLPDRVLKYLISTAFSLLYPGGKFIIAHKDKEKYRPLPPEWLMDWVSEPRSVDGFIKLAEDSGIKDYSFNLDWEESNVIFFLVLTKKG
ncbi:MAG: PilZ domain-containing protein [Nitrospirae bacterium]|nr:PilZ domain-containing protein [Nitrospirota bacterium]